jgi:hypothetical protein
MDSMMSPTVNDSQRVPTTAWPYLIDRFSGILQRHGKGPLGKGDEMTILSNELFETQSCADED